MKLSDAGPVRRLPALLGIDMGVVSVDNYCCELNLKTMSTLERAIAIAAEAHAGQIDKASAPYILHPLRVMMRLSTEDERIVAVLHDVCEDSPDWTFERLRREGFSERILEALQTVTKRDGEDYEAFVLRAAANPIGRRVKLSDLYDNSDLSRIARPTERDHQRIARYRRAIAVIEAALERDGEPPLR